MNFFRRKGTAAFLILAIILFFSWNGVLPFDRIARAVSRVFIAPLYTFLERPTNDLARENKELRELLTATIGDRVHEELLSQRANAEEKILSWANQRSLPKPLLAHVFTRFEQGESVFYMLDRGTRDGVYDRAAVIAGDGVLLGRIAEVRQTTALLRLLTQNEQRFSLTKEKTTQPIGIAQGRNNDTALSVTFVPRETSFILGDVLVTSGLDDGVPRDLLVGSVREIIPIANSPWQELALRPFAYPSDLATVGILLFGAQ